MRKGEGARERGGEGAMGRWGDGAIERGGDRAIGRGSEGVGDWASGREGENKRGIFVFDIE